MVEILKAECSLSADSIVADIGSGTGILSEMFLKNGNLVYGVEPNLEMREAGENLLRNYPRFRSVAARAEETSLPAASVDFITAGQSFHWFDRELVKVEFARLLKASGWVVLVWNERLTTTTPFLIAYEELLKTYSTDYAQVDHRRMDDAVMRDFFGPDAFSRRQLKNEQVFDYEGIRGRLESSSYAPEPGHPNYLPMLEELQRIFEAHQQDGQVVCEYLTQIYYGHLN
ncbi:MAG TPA: class I SAM-dependent methyltransferase [Blastocatellia bacterium]|nr:class I SAM-dependent methyltransferase [Blastocatellia bacterium]